MLTVADVGADALAALLHRYDLELVVQAPGESIMGSFWGDPEAGVVGGVVYVRADTDSTRWSVSSKETVSIAVASDELSTSCTPESFITLRSLR